MCLSSVYRKTEGESVFLFKNIAGVEISGDSILFTDIMGVRTEIQGKIQNIDLLENTITVETKEAI